MPQMRPQSIDRMITNPVKKDNQVALITRKIGLSLGADICWPICYEALLDKLDLEALRAKRRLTIPFVREVLSD